MKPLGAVFQLAFILVLFNLLTIFMIWPTTGHHGTSIDLAKAQFPYPHAEADRPDALVAAVSHDGKIYFGPDQLNPDGLADRIRDTRRFPRQPLFIKSDARARYGTVKFVLDAARTAGVQKVVFLVEKRRSPK